MNSEELQTLLNSREHRSLEFKEARNAWPRETGNAGMMASEKTSEITRVKAREKILNMLKVTPTMTTAELARELGLTDKGVAWQLKRLQDKKRLRRVGPAKGGHWEVLEREDGGHA